MALQILKIYIPIWFDLNEHKNVIRDIETYLHSNMVRFKQDNGQKQSTKKKIYIPIWFDLNQTGDSIGLTYPTFTFQYGSI